MLEGLFGFLRNWLFGLRGFEELTAGTYARPTGWYLIQVDQDSVFEATVATGRGDDLSSGTRVQGYQVYGEFVEITVASGTVLAYQIAANDTTTAS